MKLSRLILIRNRLAAVKPLRSIVIKARTDIDPRAMGQLIEAIKVSENEIQMFRERFNILNKVRNMIAQANHEAGINELITEMATLQKLKESLVGDSYRTTGVLYRSSVQGTSYSDFKTMCDNFVAAKGKDIPEARIQTVNVNVSNEVYEELRKKIVEDIAKRLLTLEDKRNELNATTEIDVPKELLVAFENHKVI